MSRPRRHDLYMGAKAISAAVIGALCGVGWFASIEPLGDASCRGSGLGCALMVILLLVPALAVVWMFVAWGLLKLARFSPAWPTAIGGMVGTVVLMIISGYVLDALHLRLADDDGALAVTLAGAGGYALAAVLTAGYGVPRDRTEHRGQDG